MKFCLYNVSTTIKIGGIETYYWEVAHELKKKNHTVELIAGKGPIIKYDHLPIRLFPFTPRHSVPKLGNRFQKFGERLSFFKNAWPYIRKQKYDVFLIRKPFDFFAAYLVKKRNPDIKTVFVSGGEDFYGFDRFFSRSIDMMFAVSRENASIIESRYGRRVPVIPNGVDTEKFLPRPKSGEELREKLGIADSPTLVSVGRVVGWKGFQLVIDILGQLPDCHYILIGDGEYLDQLKTMAIEADLEARVHFLGAIEHRKLPEYLSAGDIFVQPSIGHEAFGITLVEAMACGLPVVASRNGGMVDIVEEGINGYLFETGSKEDLVRKIKQCFRERENFDPRKYVEEHFTWSMTVAKLLNYLEDSPTV